ncbi:TPA: hypothetical protein PBO67_004515 [Escherichia coli]|nr:hypothetical protein [Escherichia coli]
MKRLIPILASAASMTIPVAAMADNIVCHFPVVVIRSGFQNLSLSSFIIGLCMPDIGWYADLPFAASSQR